MSDSRDDHLREQLVSGERIFQGRLLDVRRDTVRLPDGGTATREYIVHPGAVMVVPLLDHGRLVIERQYRYPLDLVLIEFPAGRIDPGEQPFTCAMRELAEETGYRAREWARAGSMHNACGYSSEAIEVWFARGLVLGERGLDHGEFVDVSSATLEELLALAASGAITDAKTLIGLMWLQNWQAGAWTLDWRPAP